MVTIRVRSMVWFATGAVMALFVSLMVMQAWRVDAAPGDTDTTFVSMTSCRLADTRPLPDRVGTNGSWGVADTKTLQATGVNGNCTIPAEAVGLSLKVFALNATAGGFLTFWDSGALPLGSALNPSPSGIVFSAVTTDLSPTGSFNVYNENGTVDVIIDVNGYYTKTSLKDVSNRLNALETAQATNIGNIATNTGNIATNTSGVAALDLAQPLSVTGEETTGVFLTSTPTAYVSVSVTAPVAGHVTLNSTAHVSHSDDGEGALCAIFETGSIPPIFIGSNTPSYQQFQGAGSSKAGSLSGTRRFDVAAGATASYSLACQELGDGGFFRIGNLTAIFTPAP